MRRRLASMLSAGVLAVPLSLGVAPSGLPCLPGLPLGLLACPAPTSPAPPAPAGHGDLAAFHGLGTWVDAYDFSREYTHGHPSVEPSAVAAMARDGVRTIYIQAAKDDPHQADLLSPDLLGTFLREAHARGMRVVAWFLPRFSHVEADDWRHLAAILAFRSGGRGFDAVGLDIEWTNDVPNVGERNRRLVALSQQLRASAPELPLAAIVLPPVVTDRINTAYWPSFPWHALRPLYDVWAPMGYYTNRSAGSRYRDAYTYTVDNVNLLRADLGDPAAPVHAVGGIGDRSTSTDYDGLVRGAAATHSIGASSYDWATTASSAWPILRRAPG